MDGQKTSILVVEDEPGVRKMLEFTLGQYGFDVRLAANGQEALTIYRQHQQVITIVLLDVQMAGMDGPQTLAALQAIDPNVRCWFMSGHTGKYSVGELLARGAGHVFQKPFRSLDELARLLREFADV